LWDTGGDHVIFFHAQKKKIRRLILVHECAFIAHGKDNKACVYNELGGSTNNGACGGRSPESRNISKIKISCMRTHKIPTNNMLHLTHEYIGFI
jgi:hypothetical protein